MITQQDLKQRLYYIPETGVFYSLTNNKVVGHVDGRGYLKVCIGYKRYALHRLAFLYMTGEFPSNIVDHINGVRNDNRWHNLREATYCDNTKNATYKIGKSGYAGVTAHGNGWRAGIKHNKKKYNLGTYETPKEAYDVYINFKKKLSDPFYKEIE